MTSAVPGGQAQPLLLVRLYFSWSLLLSPSHMSHCHLKTWCWNKRTLALPVSTIGQPSSTMLTPFWGADLRAELPRSVPFPFYIWGVSESWHFFRSISSLQLSLFVDTSQVFMQVPHHSLPQSLQFLGFTDTHQHTISYTKNSCYMSSIDYILMFSLVPAAHVS